MLLLKRAEALLILMNTIGYFCVSFISNNYNLTTSPLQTISYVIPYLILAEPRIFFTHVNVLLFKRTVNLQNVLRNVKTYENTNVLQTISVLHWQICRAAIQLQENLKIQVVLVFVKAFQDILAAFYVVMKYNGDWNVVQYLLRGFFALIELFFMIYPVERTIEVVSSYRQFFCRKKTLNSSYNKYLDF